MGSGIVIVPGKNAALQRIAQQLADFNDVTVLESANALLWRARQQPPDVVLADAGLEDMNGAELIEILPNLAPDSRLILCGARSRELDRAMKDTETQLITTDGTLDQTVWNVYQVLGIAPPAPRPATGGLAAPRPAEPVKAEPPKVEAPRTPTERPKAENMRPAAPERPRQPAAEAAPIQQRPAPAREESAPPARDTTRIEQRPAPTRAESAPPARDPSRPAPNRADAPPARMEQRPPPTREESAPPARDPSRPTSTRAESAPPAHNSTRIEQRPAPARAEPAPPARDSTPEGRQRIPLGQAMSMPTRPLPPVTAKPAEPAPAPVEAKPAPVAEAKPAPVEAKPAPPLVETPHAPPEQRAAPMDPFAPRGGPLIIRPQQTAAIRALMSTLATDVGAQSVLLSDTAGMVLLESGEVPDIMTRALGPLLATSFSTATEISRQLRETESNALYLHEGARYDIYAFNVGYRFILTLIFDKDAGGSKLGSVWVYAKRATRQLEMMLNR